MNHAANSLNRIPNSLLVFIAISTISFSIATAQNTPKQWDIRFGTSGTDHFTCLQQTSDGGYIFGGYTSSGISGDKTKATQGGWDYWIVKTDANGTKQWDADFGGSGSDDLESLQQTSDDGFILGGSSLSGISGDKTQAKVGGYDYWIIKIDANGVKQWDATFGGSNDDELRGIQQTKDGGYILGGYSESGISGDKTQADKGGYDYWIVKVNANGVKQWDATFGGSQDDAFYEIRQLPDRGYIFGGYSNSGISGDKTQANKGGRDMWVIKTDSNGVKQWDKDYGGGLEDDLLSLCLTTDGGYAYGGLSNNDFYMVKVDASGVQQWDAHFGGSNIDIANSIQQTSDGGYILGGNSLSGLSGNKTQASQGGYDYWIVKTDDTGVKQWDARYGGSNNEDSVFYHRFEVRQTVDGGYVLGGESLSGSGGDKSQSSQGSWDYWIVKTIPGCSPQSYYSDNDADGYGSSGDGTISCTLISGYATNNTDCNDANSAINPGATEVCTNGIDDNCNGAVDESCCTTTPPTGTVTTSITSSSATLNWNSMQGATKYKLKYKQDINGSNWNKQTVTSTSTIINGLLPNSKYKWKVKNICGSGTSSDWCATSKFTTLPGKLEPMNEDALRLDIFPNPAQDIATIQFDLLQPSRVRVVVCDMSGKEIDILVNDLLETGNQSIPFYTSQFSSGVYLVKVVSDFGIANRKLIIE